MNIMRGNTGLAPFGGASVVLPVLFRTGIAAALLLLMGSLAGPLQTKAEEPVVEISIDNFTFAPAEVLAIAVGRR